MFNYKIYIMKLNKHHIKHILKVQRLIEPLGFTIILFYNHPIQDVVARPIYCFRFDKSSIFDIHAIVIDKVTVMNFRPYTFKSYKNFNIASHLLFTLLK